MKKYNKENKVYFLLNKPRGVISSVKDDKKRTTVVDLIDTNILELEKKSEIELKEIYDKIDRICMINSSRILSAFIENKVFQLYSKRRNIINY